MNKIEYPTVFGTNGRCHSDAMCFMCRFSSHILAELCHLLSSQLVKYGIPIRGIPIVSRAIR
jgi:hypothetical protein